MAAEPQQLRRLAFVAACAFQRLANEVLLNLLKIDAFRWQLHGLLILQIRRGVDKRGQVHVLNWAVARQLCRTQNDAAKFGNILRPMIVLKPLYCRITDRLLAGNVTRQQQDIAWPLTQRWHAYMYGYVRDQHRRNSGYVRQDNQQSRPRADGLRLQPLSQRRVYGLCILMTAQQQ